MYDPALGRWFVMDPLAEVVSSVTPYNYGYNNPILMRDIGGLYSSVSEMIQDAWDAVGENESGYFTYQDGQETSRTIVKNFLEPVISEILYKEGRDDYNNWGKPEPPKEIKSVTAARISLKEKPPMFETTILIGGQAVKVRILYVGKYNDDVYKGINDGKGWSGGFSAYEHYIIFGSDGEVTAYVYILNDKSVYGNSFKGENVKAYNKGKGIMRATGARDAAIKAGHEEQAKAYQAKIDKLKK